MRAMTSKAQRASRSAARRAARRQTLLETRAAKREAWRRRRARGWMARVGLAPVVVGGRPRPFGVARTANPFRAAWAALRWLLAG